MVDLLMEIHPLIASTVPGVVSHDSILLMIRLVTPFTSDQNRFVGGNDASITMMTEAKALETILTDDVRDDV